ncbi:MAG: hexose transporter hxt1 [Bathelium mastoideum]|nr:MAG: hexose transporter hxt1 [Bathelium mastoideum]KAI9688426.1 MAG: hexose transporter hxt1 [Bathelium mastoideum]
MGLLQRFKGSRSAGSNENGVADGTNGHTASPDTEKGTHEPVKLLSARVISMGLIVSMGGFIFGYDTGQISGFLEMSDFLGRFGNTTKDGKPAFTNARSGTIVALLSIGTLMGAIIAAPIANAIGRKFSIVFWNVIFCVGVIVQISTQHHWYQVAIGRWVAGLGVGALSVLTPMYQSETAPRQIRGALVSCYQLFITLGIFVADCINFGTEKDTTARSWRLPMGLGFIWPVIMSTGILFLPETPRWEYRRGKIDSARATIAKSYGVSEDHWEVRREMREIQEKFEAESAGGGKHTWWEVFTGPRMAYRTLLGMTLQMLQQLTGANFFFYYGTTIFQATGISNSFVTAMILGGVNFGCTFGGLYVVEHFGRRRALIFGGFWMFCCFIVFASIGHYSLNQQNPQATPGAGAAMIVFACLFIAGYAMTWAPIVWAYIGEIYPSRYRALAMGLATASNWTWNFLIAFFTPFITGDIDYRYGYVFAACNFAGAFVTYFFVCETQGKSLEEIDTMYILRVPPWKSSKWVPPSGEDLVTTDKLNLTPGARDIRKEDGPGEGAMERNEG